MVMTDPIADMLTRIRNANQAKHLSVTMPASRLKLEILNVFKNEGYISEYEKVEDGKQGVIKVTLKYNNKERVIQGLKKISKVRAFLEKNGKGDLPIEVDGNVSYENAVLMNRAGADIFVAGTSSVFSEDLHIGIQKLRDCIKN